MNDHTAREESIIATTLDLAEERGVAGVTTAALARRLEFTEAALYRYFPSKGAIIAASLRHLGNRLFATMMLELMPESVGHGHTFQPQLERHIRRFALRNGLLVELLLSAASGREAELQATGFDFLQSYGERMTEYFRQLHALDQLVATTPPSERARLWICQLLGGFVTAHLAREAWDPVRNPGFQAFAASLQPSHAAAGR
jgi:TetR/AcrR family transcriptional regulator